jgi:hypothetical protein
MVSRCKMAETGFHCFANYRAPLPRFATIRITAWQSALNCTADCQPSLSGLIRTLRPVQAFGIPLSNSHLCCIAIQGTAIFSVAARLENMAICQYSVMNLSAEFSNRVKSSPHHFTSRGPCLNCHIFFKSDFTSLKLIRRAWFRSKLYVNGPS